MEEETATQQGRIYVSDVEESTEPVESTPSASGEAHAVDQETLSDINAKLDEILAALRKDG